MNTGTSESAVNRSKPLQVGTQWAEARGWSRRFHQSPEDIETAMQFLAGFHGAVEWHKSSLQEALAARFGEGVDVLQAVKITIACLDELCPDWRTEGARIGVGDSPSTTDFIDHLLREPELTPFEQEQAEWRAEDGGTSNDNI